MRQSLRLGRVAGIPVGAHWTVGVILVVITQILGVNVLPAAAAHQSAAVYWAVAAGTALLFAASLLVHELMHAVVAKRYGVQVRSITLWMLGGLAEFEGDPPSPSADLRIAMAGPAASGALTGGFAGVAGAVDYAAGPAVVTAAITWLALMNGMLAVFNMLPGAPLDGGRVLRAMLWRHHGDRDRAAVAAAKAGQVLGAGSVLAGLASAKFLGSIDGLWLLLIGVFLISAATAEARTIPAMAALAGLRVSDMMTPDPLLAPAGFTVAGFTGVAARCRQDVFPVVDPGGALAGLLFSDTLARVPPDDRPRLTLGEIALKVPPAYLAAPEDPAGPLLTRPALRGKLAAIVLDHGQVTGLVTTDDLRSAVRRARLQPSASLA